MDRRQLNFFDALMLVMGGIIGVGIFYRPARVAALVPNGGWFLGLWVLGGLTAMCGALTFAELGGTFPRAGGWYLFLREAWGRFVAFLFAWVVLLVVASAACAVMARICVDNLAVLVPSLGTAGGLAFQLAGGGVLFGTTLLAMLGAKAGATFQNGCMLLKLGAIGAIAAGAFFVFDPSTRIELVAGSAAAAPVVDRALTAGNIGLAMLAVLFCCGGWQHLCYIAPLVRDPQKTLPRAIVFGVLGVVVVYVVINAAYLRLLGLDGLAGNATFAQDAARLALGGLGGKLLSGAMAISALGVAIVTIVATPWLYVAMAREGLFFARFAKVSERTGAPVAALAVQCVLCLAWWFVGQADVAADSAVFAEWIFHALVAAALLRLRAQRPDLPRPFRSPLYPLAPIAYLLLALAVVGNTLWSGEWSVTGTSLGVLALGAAIYLPWRRWVGSVENAA